MEALTNMTSSHPFFISGATRFRPSSFRGHNRSPSRSPVRKSLFLAREIDPFLSNLSPDSTLQALQATSTIVEGSDGQDILAQSIADASPEEREIGIRAALTAQKLKQWRVELEQWSWPSARDRASGAGFLPPRRPSVPMLMATSNSHMGYLPFDSVQAYQDKIEDIRDGIEALELEDIKDHIFSSHAPVVSPTGQDEEGVVQTSVGKMRDFTALVTATVVQALPDLAHVNMMLDTWDIRLSILRQIPTVEDSLKSVKAGIETARSIIRDDKAAARIDTREFQNTKTVLGDKVASLGSKIDHLLDLLEGQEDTLPKSWIDSLENIENDFVTWVEEAEHLVIQNGLSRKTLVKQPSIQIHAPEHEDVKAQTSEPVPQASPAIASTLTIDDSALDEIASPIAELPDRQKFTFPLQKKVSDGALHSRKPSLTIKPLVIGRHRREVSEVSVADSAFSGMSDLSSAEIVDARSTQVLASPKISLIDNPFRASHDGLSWLLSQNINTVSNNQDLPKPPELHRASTASIQVVSKDDVRPVTLIRSQSLDLLGSARHSPPSTPSRALRQLLGQDSVPPTPQVIIDTNRSLLAVSSGSPEQKRRSSMSKHPSLLVEPLRTKSRQAEHDLRSSPPVPRRSSKRLQRTPSEESSIPSSPDEPTEPQTPDPVEEQQAVLAEPKHSLHNSMGNRKPETLEDKIKGILTTIPTRIRLADSVEPNDAKSSSLLPHMRSTTPTPILTLSPAKADRSNRKAAPGDVRVFHLSQSGQSKIGPPVKLFVRTVGENGERVMVRVGGGWADLAEYLQEYSLHHGHRGLSTEKLEVASLPTNAGGKSSVTPTTPTPSSTFTSKTVVEHDQVPKRRFSLSSLSNLAVGRSRKNSRSKSIGEGDVPTKKKSPPPVPSIPYAYTVTSPTTVVKTSNGSTHVTVLPATPYSSTVAASKTHPINHTPNYVPLGAAGPKSGGRRTASYNALRGPNDDWVEGMVEKARAVSGGNSVVHGNSVTSSVSVSTPKEGKRRIFGSTTQHFWGDVSPSGAGLSEPRPGTSSRPKSRMSLADVGGIKRVFLRRKSEKV